MSDYYPYPKRDPIKNYFPLPNEIFLLGLTPGELAVYSYLMRCEERRTHQCHPSYRTIGRAVHLSPNTVAKHVNGLREKRLIVPENTEIVTRRGEKRNGTLLYTIRPVEEALRHFYEQQMQQLEAVKDQEKIRKKLRYPRSHQRQLHAGYLHPRHHRHAEKRVGHRGRFHGRTIREGVETVARKRKSGEGTLRLRKDGRWEGRIVVGYDEKGAPITKSVTAVSKAVCKEKLEELKVKCGVVTGRAKPDMPFGEWIDLWYQTWSKPGLRITTQQCYEDRIYHHIIPHIGEIALNKLTQSDLQQFYAELKRNGRHIRRDLYGPGLSDRMVCSCHTTCRIALEKAKTEGLIRVNPAVGCKLPPKKAREMQVLSHEEMQRFLIQAKEDGFYEMMLLELATGMRRGEICALMWDDLNLRTGELHIQRQVIHVAGSLHVSSPKTKSSDRTVILPPAVLAVLRELKERTDSRWMFPSPVKENAPLDPQSVYRKMKKVLVRAQCKDIRFHDLRHTFATTALEHGMDVKTLSAIIGHISSATTIDIYSHITGAMQRQAAQKIERGIGHSEAYEPHETIGDQLPGEDGKPPVSPPFAPYKGKVRKPGTGGIYELNDHLFEGRYSPTNAQGKREVHTVYAKTKEECEALLETMIAEVRERSKEEKRQMTKERRSK